ncbi:cAMP-binding domain of CRP or a regulatory subunit of cAMP-dependent protein kinases [Arboricoccus pini]|uniref:cAMP-binding domain of CRP or a regulatory subunit of cAMP-dependent protein kinases n=1 Tax=Arboricoccus pini TaxID=1963835 RepID=A0A212QRC3_9PROT|nr:Crp/Fnr family transcriptional regulator [Arboricoccus pini]SNB62141.1 cAMP-binding domain of CRP or a regulatory subunit of cAMP-dependent protein kinases [Arboricoccus pini]
MGDKGRASRQAGGVVACVDCPLRHQAAFRQFAPEELAFVTHFKAGELQITAGTDILLAEHNSAHLFTLLRGWAYRYSLLPDGRRQILNFLLPGDFIGLQAGLFDAMQHSVAALTDVTLCVFQRSELWSLYREQPSLGYDLTWLAANEEALVDANLVAVGQRTALARIAYLIVQFHARLEGVGMSQHGRFAFPLTQQHVADALGLSLVHTNKTLRRLVKLGAVKVGGGMLAIARLDQLRAIAGLEEAKPRSRPIL